MKILLTGSTSQQANPRAHRRSANFMGLIWDELRRDGSRVEVDWVDPSVHWPGDGLLRKYDHVFVGFAPPMAMGANRIYGALSVLEQLAGSPRVTIVLDSPDPDLVGRGLKSILGNWPTFTKPFFSYRQEFDLARETRTNTRLRMHVMRMLTNRWPQVLVPGMPWTDPAQVESALPIGAQGQVRVVNLDHLLLARFAAPDVQDRAWRLQEWAYEPGSDKRWLGRLNLSFPVRAIEHNHRLETDQANAKQLSESVGLLVGPSRGQAWWTPKIAMSLARLTPVFTPWLQSAQLGPAWSVLPGTHEISSLDEAEELARGQFATYAESIPAPGEARNSLFEAAGIKISHRKAAV